MKKIVVCCFIALCLAGCGKRGKLDFPPGSTYPRQYPVARQPKPVTAGLHRVTSEAITEDPEEITNDLEEAEETQ